MKKNRDRDIGGMTNRSIGARRVALFVLIAVGVLSILIVCTMLLFGAETKIINNLLAGKQYLAAHPVKLAVAFAGLSLVSQTLIMPSGSLLLMFGGLMLGAWQATMIYSMAQLITTPAMYLLVRSGIGCYAEPNLLRMLSQHLGTSWRNVARAVPDEAIATTTALRLTPVFPNAVICLLAVGLGIALKPFMIGTLLSGWMRPLFFASLGATLANIAIANDVRALLSQGGSVPLPLLLMFVSALALLAGRLWVRLRWRQKTPTINDLSCGSE